MFRVFSQKGFEWIELHVFVVNLFIFVAFPLVSIHKTSAKIAVFIR